MTTQPDFREKKFTAEQISDGETQPTYRNNVTIAVGAESTNTIAVSVAVQDQNEDLEEITPLRFIITDSAVGTGSITAVDSESITSGTEIFERVNHADYDVLTDATGDFVIELTKSGDSNLYMGVYYGNRLFMSGVIAFTT